MISLEDKVAVVTGAGNGIGRSIALALAKAGCDLVIADIELSAADTVAQEVRQHGRKAIGLSVDVADRDAVFALADRAFGEFGSVDVLVNNAGVTMRPFRTIWDASDEDWAWIMGVNFYGVLHGVRAFVPRMLAQPGAKHIVNTSSIAPWLRLGGHALYTASKAAVDGLSMSLRAELEHTHIGLTVLVPGHIATTLGTSERLRPEGDRSENRKVRSYSEFVAEYHKEQDGGPQAPVPANGSAITSVYQTIQVDGVGAMVVNAILNDKPFCYTHPAPDKEMDEIVAELKSAYDPSWCTS